MARIEVNTHIETPPERVWEVLVDWESQPRWMADARTVTVLSPQRTGTGTVLRCRTDLAGLVVTDDMQISEWEEHRLVGVRHLGRLIRGVGAFQLEPTPHGTHLLWWEEIDPPLGAVGEALTQVLVAPFVARTARRSVANLKRLCESRAVRPHDPPPATA